MAEIFRFIEYKNEDLIDLTEKLAAMAKSGEIKSMVSIIDFGHNVHKWVVAGDYVKDPGVMFRPCNKLFFEVQRLDEERGAACV